VSAELAGKRLQLLKRGECSLGRVAVLWNARDAVMTTSSARSRLRRRSRWTVQPLGVQEAKDIDGAIAAMTRGTALTR